jgi:DNA-binding PadR family transcriptional regulator
MMTMFKTHSLRAVVATLLANPEADRYGAEIKAATGIESSSVYSILQRLAAAGYIEDLGPRASEVGGSPRHVYRVVDIDGLRRLID